MKLMLFSRVLRLHKANLIYSRHIYTSKVNNILRRAVLYVPGNDTKKIKKATNVDVDSIILDCEDGVAMNRKEDARKLILETLNQNVKFICGERSIRVNSMENGLAEEDLNLILQSKNLPPTIFFPKVDNVENIDWIVDKLDNNLKHRNHKLNFIIYTESARGLLNLEKICQRALTKCEGTSYKLDGIVFGSDDFCANIGAARTSNAVELMYARQHVVVVAKAFGLQAIDMVYINYKDLTGLQQNSAEGSRMGFTGKQIIHPDQVPIVQEQFSPSKEKIEWAEELMKTFESHQKSGQGAFSFRGQMIDMPTVLQAKNILQLSSVTKKSN